MWGLGELKCEGAWRVEKWGAWTVEMWGGGGLGELKCGSLESWQSCRNW